MTEMAALMEQLDAAHDIAHHYTCAFCEEFAGHKAVILAVDHEEGVRIVLVTACVSCAKEIPNASEKTT